MSDGSQVRISHRIRRIRFQIFFEFDADRGLQRSRRFVHPTQQIERSRLRLQADSFEQHLCRRLVMLSKIQRRSHAKFHPYRARKLFVRGTELRNGIYNRSTR